MGLVVIFIVFGVVIMTSAVRILPEWERGVVLRFGNLVGVRGPGLVFLIPLVETLIKVDTRTITMDIQPQDVITRDNVSLKVNAVVYFQVSSPEAAIIRVENYYFATSQLAQTALRSVLGQYQLDELLSSREKINQALRDILDRQADKWGINISMVEVKDIDLPKEMQRAMARQAEAERERRAKVISAEGEVERAHKLSEAANTLSSNQAALQLAYLQTLTELAGDKSNTIVFPVPLDMLSSFIDKSK